MAGNSPNKACLVCSNVVCQKPKNPEPKTIEAKYHALPQIAMSATAASRSFLRSASAASRMASAQKAGSKPAFSPFRISQQSPFSPRIVKYQKLWKPRNAIGLNKMRKGLQY